MSAMMGVDPLKIPSGGLLSAFSPSLSYFGFSATLGSTPAPGFVTSALGFEGGIVKLGGITVTVQRSHLSFLLFK